MVQKVIENIYVFALLSFKMYILKIHPFYRIQIIQV